MHSILRLAPGPLLVVTALAVGPAARPAAADATPAVLVASVAPDRGDASGDYVFPSARQRWRDWAMSAVGPGAIGSNLAGASWRHWVTDEPEEWDTTERGFLRRFGCGSATTLVSETSLALGSEMLRQDACYYRSPERGLGPRALHVLRMSFCSRARDGRTVFSPAKTIAPFVGPVVTTTLLYPDGYTVADGALSGAYALLLGMGWNALREFVVPTPPWRGTPPRGR